MINLKNARFEKNSNMTRGCTNKWPFPPFWRIKCLIYLLFVGQIIFFSFEKMLDKVFNQNSFGRISFNLKKHLCILLNNSLV